MKPNIKRSLEVAHKLLGDMVIIWVLFCFISTSIIHVENRLKLEVEATQEFKNNCFANKGRVRHEEGLLSLNLYCVLNNGDEAVFYTDYEVHSFVISFTDKVTFGSLLSNRIP